MRHYAVCTETRAVQRFCCEVLFETEISHGDIKIICEDYDVETLDEAYCF